MSFIDRYYEITFGDQQITKTDELAFTKYQLYIAAKSLSYSKINIPAEYANYVNGDILSLNDITIQQSEIYIYKLFNINPLTIEQELTVNYDKIVEVYNHLAKISPISIYIIIYIILVHNLVEFFIIIKSATLTDEFLTLCIADTNKYYPYRHDSVMLKFFLSNKNNICIDYLTKFDSYTLNYSLLYYIKPNALISSMVFGGDLIWRPLDKYLTIQTFMVNKFLDIEIDDNMYYNTIIWSVPIFNILTSMRTMINKKLYNICNKIVLFKLLYIYHFKYNHIVNKYTLQLNEYKSDIINDVKKYINTYNIKLVCISISDKYIHSNINSLLEWIYSTNLSSNLLNNP
jgi:hypothetical protein